MTRLDKKATPDAVPEAEMSEAPPNGPLGDRKVLNLSPAFLNPGAGLRVRKSGQSEKCGLIWGAVERGFRHPNFKDNTKTSIRWHGAFAFQMSDGRIGRASTVYLPGVVERDLLSLGVPIVAEGDGMPPSFRGDFSVEIWCEADEEGTSRPSAMGYTYAVYDRTRRRLDIDNLAPPEVRAALGLPAVDRELLGYDSETGEVELHLEDQTGDEHVAENAT